MSKKFYFADDRPQNYDRYIKMSDRDLKAEIVRLEIDTNRESGESTKKRTKSETTNGGSNYGKPGR